MVIVVLLWRQTRRRKADFRPLPSFSAPSSSCPLFQSSHSPPARPPCCRLLKGTGQPRRLRSCSRHQPPCRPQKLHLTAAAAAAEVAFPHPTRPTKKARVQPRSGLSTHSERSPVSASCHPLPTFLSLMLSLSLLPARLERGPEAVGCW
jgi:hypothetical protein